MVYFLFSMYFLQIPLILLSVYIGWRMGRGEPLMPQKMKKAVRSEAQEAELEKKLKHLQESKHPPKRG